MNNLLYQSPAADCFVLQSKGACSPVCSPLLVQCMFMIIALATSSAFAMIIPSILGAAFQSVV